MQQMETLDYINERPRHQQKRSRDRNPTGKGVIQLLFISFGVLCITQAILNVVLRLTLYVGKELNYLNCSSDNFCHYKTLQERVIALTRDISLLEESNSKLNNMLRTVREERDRLKMQLNDQSCCQCPADWMKINSRCYFLSRVSKNWEESRKDCQSKGADLVVINSAEEQTAIYRLNGESVLLFWIGLYNLDGTFKWVDGSALTVSFWQLGQPDGDPTNRQDCVESYHLNPVLANWNDAPCEKIQRWLCEKDPSSSS
ncbi:CD209 antigen-like protein D [Mastacembelus armatus]|uniref:CD209 antigen-like protein D n=1 Tax=Mastacembelus armatus TaxID=205130 RepID=A0A7N8XV14_9TELE|nr:CD209 antigen-like protein D [Mastacembelus armatus]